MTKQETLSKLMKLLQLKSQQLNLFSAGDREKLESKHLPDSLAMLDFVSFQDGCRVIDLGSGGGLPGLALAISFPNVNFVLVDSVEKKVRALNEVIEELGIENAYAIAQRIEELAHSDEFRGGFDYVTARALAELPTLLEYAAGFLKDGGRLIAWKSSDYDAELHSSELAQQKLGLNFVEAHGYELSDGENRSILVFEKSGTLDEKYPRRTGIPSKRPL